ncbi:MAG: Xaa-Pro aminopeptidase [Gammaproteobacteria bacterium]|nr:Xaa-Pro aminopeptidase [Gammaproteobacteria bacterium]
MNSSEFARRRRRLMRMMGGDSIAILPTAVSCQRNRDVEYPFRPDSNFYYLSGFPEQDAVLVLVPERKHGEYILFCRENDATAEMWNGRRTGLKGACDLYGADDAFPLDDIDDILPGLMENRERVFYTMGLDKAFDQRLMDWLNSVRDKSRMGVHAPAEFVALEHPIHEMRLIKSRTEIKTMRHAIKAATAAHKRAMRTCQPGMMEYQVEAELLHEFMQAGCRDAAYASIVGGGENACILHYTENRSILKEGDLLLIDAGAEHLCYASDITRTFPVNGRFSNAQKQLYDVVLQAQLAAIDKVTPGAAWNEPHEAAVRVLTKGLLKLGLLKGTLAKAIKEEHYKKFYPHKTGHWLGMDVHDVGDYKVDGLWRCFEPGMVLTVEPGLYIPAGSPRVAKKWWDIGIRIEDDVLVTRDGCEVLSRGVPKTTEEIEALMNG